jgi:hypothetical protein
MTMNCFNNEKLLDYNGPPKKIRREKIFAKYGPLDIP